MYHQNYNLLGHLKTFLAPRVVVDTEINWV